MEFDRIIFGKVKGVTDKDAYTTSFEIPKECEWEKKIKIEAPYHELTNGGHITTVYTKENIEKVLEKMYNSDIGFGKIKFIG